MRTIRLRRPSPAMAVALVALVVALGGTAGAAVIITSNSQVAANTISGAFPPSGDTANLIGGSVGGNDLHAGGVTHTAMAANSVGTTNVVNGSLTAAKLAKGVIGARAYGYVTGGGALDVTNSHNVTTSTSPGTGQYCVQLSASIDAGTAAYTVSPDYDNDTTTPGEQAVVEPALNPPPACPANSIVVQTFTETVSGGGLSLTPHAEPFFIVVG